MNEDQTKAGAVKMGCLYLAEVVYRDGFGKPAIAYVQAYTSDQAVAALMNRYDQPDSGKITVTEQDWQVVTADTYVLDGRSVPAAS